MYKISHFLLVPAINKRYKGAGKEVYFLEIKLWKAEFSLSVAQHFFLFRLVFFFHCLMLTHLSCSVLPSCLVVVWCVVVHPWYGLSGLGGRVASSARAEPEGGTSGGRRTRATGSRSGGAGPGGRAGTGRGPEVSPTHPPHPRPGVAGRRQGFRNSWPGLKLGSASTLVQ